MQVVTHNDADEGRLWCMLLNLQASACRELYYSNSQSLSANATAP